ncbi:MAG: ABC transporter permease [Kiritimatiellae bacterium]|nr:ABC transporter permease [Kiritimatiellia bacterium]MDD5521860.1 ABC transporter permease [Kiritimatiellia bacterium]
MNIFGSNNITTRFLSVWCRNWIVYLRTWKINFIPPLLEPILYVAAFGVGFRLLVPSVQFHGQEMSYVQFIAPALVAVSIMNSSFFETTYASFVRMYYQKTFDAMMSAPVSVQEVITGEIVWGATRSLMTAAVTLAVLSCFGLFPWPEAFWILPVAVLGGFAFAAIGMMFTGLIPNIELFNLPVFLFITPMFLFSGTFFSIDTLPEWAQWFALILPLTHLVNLCREICCGSVLSIGAITAGIYLVVFSAIFYPLALRTMRKRLIK